MRGWGEMGRVGWVQRPGEGGRERFFFIFLFFYFEFVSRLNSIPIMLHKFEYTHMNTIQQQ